MVEDVDVEYFNYKVGHDLIFQNMCICCRSWHEHGNKEYGNKVATSITVI